MIDTLVHVLLVLTLPPLLPGVIAKTKAAFAGRNGPPLLQGYWDLAKLLRKGSVLPQGSTWVFLAGPVAGVAAPLVASFLLPFGGHSAPVSFAGDMVLFAYLFALARFFTASAALDTGSAFEGMGAAREVAFSALAEPALFFGFVALARISGSLSLSGMLGAQGWATAGAPLVLVAASWAVVLLAENCRIPFDDPNTHLELTMIHEVMVLDHGGPAFGLVLYGASVKLFVLSALFLRVVFPFSAIDSRLDWLAFVAGILLVAIGIGVVESVMARLKLLKVPQLLVGACLLSAFGMLLLAR
jgi:formate hydrogenlyase subunit 4